MEVKQQQQQQKQEQSPNEKCNNIELDKQVTIGMTEIMSPQNNLDSPLLYNDSTMQDTTAELSQFDAKFKNKQKQHQKSKFNFSNLQGDNENSLKNESESDINSNLNDSDQSSCEKKKSFYKRKPKTHLDKLQSFLKNISSDEDDSEFYSEDDMDLMVSTQNLDNLFQNKQQTPKNDSKKDSFTKKMAKQDKKTEHKRKAGQLKRITLSDVNALEQLMLQMDNSEYDKQTTKQDKFNKSKTQKITQNNNQQSYRGSMQQLIKENEIENEIVNKNKIVQENDLEKQMQNIKLESKQRISDNLQNKDQVLEDNKVQYNKNLSVTENINYLKSDNNKKNVQIAKLKVSQNMAKWRKATMKIVTIKQLSKVMHDIRKYGTNVSQNFGITPAFINKVKYSLQRKTLLQERRQKTKWVLHPEKKFLGLYYPFYLFFIYFWIAIIAPWHCFIFSHDNLKIGWYILNKFIDLTLTFDIIIQCFSGFINNKGQFINSHKQILLLYIRKTFILDVLSIFPFEIINLFIPNIDENSILKTMYYNQAIKLLRLPFIYYRIRKAKQFQDVGGRITSSAMFRFCRFITNTLLATHIVGCFYYFIAKVHQDEQNWVQSLQLHDKDEYDHYVWAIYWAIQSITTVGFGDVKGTNDTERIVCLIWMIFGAGIFSYTLGAISTIIIESDSRRSTLQNNIYVVDEFCKETGLNNILREKMRKALQYHSLKTIINDNEREQFFDDLPEGLKLNLSDQMFTGKNNTKRSLPFLDGIEYNSIFISQFIKYLNPLQISKGEYVYVKGEIPTDLYFIISGRVQFTVGRKEYVFKSFVQGSYFGELEIFQDTTRLYSVKCKEDCELLTMQVDHYKDLMSQFPKVNKKMQNLALLRAAKFLQAAQDFRKKQHQNQKQQREDKISKLKEKENMQANIVKENLEKQKDIQLENIKELENKNKVKKLKLKDVVKDEIQFKRDFGLDLTSNIRRQSSYNDRIKMLESNQGKSPQHVLYSINSKDSISDDNNNGRENENIRKQKVKQDTKVIKPSQFQKIHINSKIKNFNNEDRDKQNKKYSQKLLKKNNTKKIQEQQQGEDQQQQLIRNLNLEVVGEQERSQEYDVSSEEENSQEQQKQNKIKIPQKINKFINTPSHYFDQKNKEHFQKIQEKSQRKVKKALTHHQNQDFEDFSSKIDNKKSIDKNIFQSQQNDSEEASDEFIKIIKEKKNVSNAVQSSFLRINQDMAESRMDSKAENKLGEIIKKGQQQQMKQISEDIQENDDEDIDDLLGEQSFQKLQKEKSIMIPLRTIQSKQIEPYSGIEGFDQVEEFQNSNSSDRMTHNKSKKYKIMKGKIKILQNQVAKMQTKLENFSNLNAQILSQFVTLQQKQKEFIELQKDKNFLDLLQQFKSLKKNGTQIYNLQINTVNPSNQNNKENGQLQQQQNQQLQQKLNDSIELLDFQQNENKNENLYQNQKQQSFNNLSNINMKKISSQLSENQSIQLQKNQSGNSIYSKNNENTNQNVNDNQSGLIQFTQENNSFYNNKSNLDNQNTPNFINKENQLNQLKISPKSNVSLNNSYKIKQPNQSPRDEEVQQQQSPIKTETEINISSEKQIQSNLVNQQENYDIKSVNENDQKSQPSQEEEDFNIMQIKSHEFI